MASSAYAREALDKLYEAFERHYAIAHDCDDIFDDRVDDAESALQRAFFDYDRQLFDETGLDLPFDIIDDDNDVTLIDNYGGKHYVTNDDDFEDDQDETTDEDDLIDEDDESEEEIPT